MDLRHGRVDAIHDGPLRGYLRMRGGRAKRPPFPKSVTHIL